MIDGNKTRGYNIGMWNCRRGLLTGSGVASSKLDEIKLFISKNRLHVLCVIEADLHSRMSRSVRKNHVTGKEIDLLLGIPGYKIHLPSTWKQHGQARIMVYARDDLKVKERPLAADLADLPMITLEIGFSVEKKTIVNFFYREFTSGVTGLNTTKDQLERLDRMVKHWKYLARSNRDLVCLGDANLCASKWNDDNYYLKDLAELVQTFLLETGSCQLVKGFTRSEIAAGGDVSRSLIDHCYSNAPGKVSTPEVIAVGTSDHLGVSVTKYTRAPIKKPKVILKRSYRNFEVEDFLRDVADSDINNTVTACKNVDEAAFQFESTFKCILDKHAPIKLFQMRKNYSSCLSESTKRLLETRNSWKEVAVNHGYIGA